jgi:hypothetical protein
MRQHPRIAQTDDLSVSLRPEGHPITRRQVLNLSEGGMLISGREVGVGEVAYFEISGPFFRYAGFAQAAHHTDGATGLRFLRSQGQPDGSLHTLINKRLRDGAIA